MINWRREFINNPRTREFWNWVQRVTFLFEFVEDAKTGIGICSGVFCLGGCDGFRPVGSAHGAFVEGEEEVGVGEGCKGDEAPGDFGLPDCGAGYGVMEVGEFEDAARLEEKVVAQAAGIAGNVDACFEDVRVFDDFFEGRGDKIGFGGGAGGSGHLANVN